MMKFGLPSTLGFTPLLLTAFLLGFPSGARGQEDGRVKKILDRITSEMKRIDELLQKATATASRSGRNSGSAKDSSRIGISETKKILESTTKSNERVIRYIDELLKIASRKKNRGSSCENPGGSKDSSSSPSKKRPSDRPDDREGVSPRNMSKKEGDPRSAATDPKTAKQRKQGVRKPEDPTGPASKRKGAGRWGDLPAYLKFLFQRGGAPKIPSKYRRFAEEFFKKVDRAKKR